MSPLQKLAAWVKAGMPIVTANGDHPRLTREEWNEVGNALSVPFGWYCELVHVASGQVIRDAFFRDAPITGPDADVQGFEWRATPVAAIAKGEGRHA